MDKKLKIFNIFYMIFHFFWCFFAGITVGWIVMDIITPDFTLNIYTVICSISLFPALIGRTIFQELIRNLEKKKILQNQNIKRNEYIKND